MSEPTFDVGRRDFLSILTYLLMALFGRLRVPAALEPARKAVERVIFKGRPFTITYMIKGFELTPEWHAALLADPDIRKTVAEATGVRFAEKT